MRAINGKLGFAVVLALGLVGSGVAWATPTSIVMPFGFFTNSEWVDNSFNGGCGSSNVPSNLCPGPNFGVVWSDALAGDPSNGGAFAQVANEPGGPGVMFVDPLGDSTSNDPLGSAFMNVAAGFTGNVLVSYSNPYAEVYLPVWSGQNGTGNQIATLSLPSTGTGCSGSSLTFSCWGISHVDFSGIGESIDFDPAGYLPFSEVGTELVSPITSVPEPADLGMLGLGLLLIGGFIGLRRRGGRRSNEAALP